MVIFVVIMICYGFVIGFKKQLKPNIDKNRMIRKIISIGQMQRRKKRDIEQAFIISMKNDICSICLEENYNYSTILSCDNEYHSKCIKKWLFIDETCPICRTKPIIH